MLFAATIFVSAFLLFQVQPLVARIILPWFGGSAAVWTTCMLFFQILLVGGYLYSHWIVRLSGRKQALIHVGVLILAVLTLPIAPDPSWKPVNGGDPTLRIIGLLAVSVGLPYFLLSTTSPLVQSWYARAKSGAVPYRLFALSNFGSMLALLSYPVLVEPLLPIYGQSLGWSGGFLLFAVLAASLAWVTRNLPMLATHADRTSGHAPKLGDYLLWIILPACASVLLLAFTTHLSTNVAPIPFLWVLPLALYLLTFILCFEGHGWYRRTLFLPLLLVGFALVAYSLQRGNIHLPLLLMIPIFAGTLFVACMVCHGELTRLQPDPRYLTAYYVMISIGGALGGLFVSMIAPVAFNDLYELPIGVVVTVIVLAASLAYQRKTRSLQIPGIVVITCAVVAGGLGFHFYKIYAERTDDAIAAMRNFYGALRVEEWGEGDARQRMLMHGTITHGRQYTSPDRQRWATSYYGEDSGIGLAIQTRLGANPAKIGVIGLGTGTLATYGRAGDTVRIYEINPQVVTLAQEQFTYLKTSPAKVDIVLGDARLVLEREAPQAYDVLAVDAFSSDAIPVHLLTVQALDEYFRHLKPDGLLVVHISNRYLDLEPVVDMLAKSRKKIARIIENDNARERGVYSSTWIVLANDEAALSHPALATGKALAPERTVRLWTDDYSDVYAILK